VFEDVAMTTTNVIHTADLTSAQRAAARGLLDRAFDGRFGADNWEHALGGLHVLISEADRLIAHAAVVQRRLLLGDRALRTGYVEAVAVESDRRGLGYGAAVMTEAERIVRSAYDLGALSARERNAGFYLGRGWQRWAGETAVLAPAGVVATPNEEFTTYVLPVAGPIELTGRLACDWRPGAVW
jgi:aminoglycoside 2'-N-acetyltransferase I